ncbi:MAG: hypothetical protein OEW91_15675 [Acidimicrobiia bacterium]|nr:hypothetical protein [Acidimicrobiia bacterium]
MATRSGSYRLKMAAFPLGQMDEPSRTPMAGSKLSKKSVEMFE